MRHPGLTVRTMAPVLAAFALLALAYTWPLALHLDEVVPRDTADPLLSTWTLWWNARVLPLTAAWWQGPIFYPAAGTLAFSDHRLGLGLIATPLLLAGAAPLTAYNVAFLLTFVLSATLAAGLAWRLTGARLPALAAGAIFGFHPFRAAHLEHLELLAAFWLPAVFWALHAWHRRRSWAALTAVAGTLTALAYTSGYYFFYGGVAVAAWVVWFERRSAPRDLLRLAAALAVPCLLVAPVLWSYREVHAAFGFTRSVTEIEFFSADLADLAAPPSMLAVWRLPWGAVHPERALFPGITALGVLLWTAWRWRWHRAATPTASRAASARRLLLGVALVALAAAFAAGLTGGVAFALGPLSVSVRVAYKPLSIAAVALLVWGLTSSPVRAAWRAQSALAFYVLATAGLWILALGPTARAFGERVAYKAPYAWLMLLPGFDSGFRAPARFAMVAALTSAVAAALALARWRAHYPEGRYRMAAAVVVGLALADGWIRPLPLHTPPAPLELPAALRADDVVLELPSGVIEDAAAMYRATMHGHRLANGLSGYHPPHYVALSEALRDGDVEALAGLPAADEVVAFVARDARGDAVRDGLVRAPWAATIAETSTHRVFRLRRAVQRPGESGSPLSVAGVDVSEAGGDAARLTDGDDRTAWATASQRGGETVVLDLGRLVDVGGVDLALGPFTAEFPRELAVDHSPDGSAWTTAWQAPTAPAVVASAIATPTAPVVAVRFTAAPARFIRMRQVATSTRPWAIAEIRVLAP